MSQDPFLPAYLKNTDFLLVSGVKVDEMVRQLEQTFTHEMSQAKERHMTHLELFKQEAGKLEAKWEERENECVAYEGRCEQLQDEILTLQTEHDEEMDRMRQDIMTAVSAIRANEEQSETQLADQVHRLTMQLAAQRESFKVSGCCCVSHFS